jgi:hypothetical protein
VDLGVIAHVERLAAAWSFHAMIVGLGDAGCIPA